MSAFVLCARSNSVEDKHMRQVRTAAIVGAGETDRRDVVPAATGARGRFTAGALAEVPDASAAGDLRTIIPRKLRELTDLPTIPAVVLEVLAKALDPDSTADELAAIIERDASLTANVLRVANSAYYGFRERVTTVKRALVALGYQTVGNIVLATTAIGAFAPSPRGRDFDTTRFWRHSLACAIALRETLACKGVRDVAEGYVVGLLHDVGKLLLNLALPEDYASVLSSAAESADPVAAVEKRVIGANHAEVGGWLLERWGIPSVLTETVLHHHAARPARDMGHPLALANAVCHALGMGCSGQAAPVAVPSSLVAEVGLSGEQLNRILSTVVEELDASCRAMGIGESDSDADPETTREVEQVGERARKRLSEATVAQTHENRRLSHEIGHLSFINELMVRLESCADLESALRSIASETVRKSGASRCVCWLSAADDCIRSATATVGSDGLVEVLLRARASDADLLDSAGQSADITVAGTKRGGVSLTRGEDKQSEAGDLELAKLVAYIMGVVIQRIALTEQYRDQAEKIGRMHRVLREAHEKLKSMHGEMVQQAKFQALGRLAAGVAHDFNNVLSAVLGCVQLAMNRDGVSGRAPDLAVIEEAALNGAEIVKRVQQLAGVGSRPKSTVLVNEVVAGALELTKYKWQQEAARNGRKFVVQADYDDGLTPVRGNGEELKQALVNLVLNAIDAMPDGGEIAVSTRQEGRKVRIQIRDSGSGMPAEVPPRLFDPFFTTKGGKGSGLGLSIVDSVIAQHGGRIEVDSEEGRGTCFTLELEGDPDAAAPAQAPPPQRHTPRKQAVLLVEDEDDIRNMMCQALALDGHKVDSFSCGADAVEAFTKSEYSVVFTDLVMPGMSGWEVAETVRRIDQSVRIVLVTGCGNEVDMCECKSHGVDGVLHKPFQIAELRRLLSVSETAA